MICKNCSYPDPEAFNFCPMCGTAQSEIRFTQPGFALLGEAFMIECHIKGKASLKIKKVSYSDLYLICPGLTIIDGCNVELTIPTMPKQNDKILRIEFVDFPTQSFNLELVDPEKLWIRVQDMYDLQIFSSKIKEPKLSFSYYEASYLDFLEDSSFLKKCTLELQFAKNKQTAIVQDTRHTFPKETFIDILKDSSVSQACKLVLMYQHQIVAQKDVLLGLNKIPSFNVLPQKELNGMRFNLANLRSPIAMLRFDVIIKKNSMLAKEIVGSDLLYFTVKSSQAYLEVKKSHRRFEKEADLIVELIYKPDVLTKADLHQLRSERKINFDLELEIKGQDFPYKIIKHYKYALVVVDEMLHSKFAVIDFGTTNSCIIDETGDFVLSKEGLKEHKSLISFRRFDADILSHEYEFPDHDVTAGTGTAFNFKSMLMRDAERSLMYSDSKSNYRVFNPKELTQIYLSELFNRIEHSSQKKPQEIVATYPAIFNKSVRELYFDLYRSAGYNINPDACMTEPEAIAYYYLMENAGVQDLAKQNKEVTVAIFDCGGGTTDYAIVSYNNTGDFPIINVAASWGTQKFSGIYLSYVLAKCSKNEAWQIPDNFEDIFSGDDKADHFRNQFTYYEKDKRELSKKIIKENNLSKAKQVLASHLLSSSPYFDVFVGTNTVSDSEDIVSIRKQLSQISEVIQSLYENKQIGLPYVDFIILAGNSCRLPLFKLHAEEEFGSNRVIMDTETIKTSVARGAYLFRSRDGNIEFQGLNRSAFMFFVYKGFDEKKVLFKRWLDMSIEHECELKYRASRSLPVTVHYSGVESRDLLAFEVKPPSSVDSGTITLRLKYHSYKIYSSWAYPDEQGNEKTSPWHLEFNHE